MKKFTSLLFALTSIVLVFAFTGCTNASKFEAQSYLSSNSTIQAVTIDVLDREVTVSISNDDQIHIEYFESEKEFYDISVNGNNELTMDFLQDKEWQDSIGTKPSSEFRKINVKIPSSLLANLTIITTNESIKVSQNLTVDSVLLSSNGGNIEFDKLKVEKTLDLTAKNGDIIGTIIGSYDVFSIDCEIKKGDCNLPLSKTDGEKSLKANCNNGNIQIDFVKA